MPDFKCSNSMEGLFISWWENSVICFTEDIYSKLKPSFLRTHKECNMIVQGCRKELYKGGGGGVVFSVSF